jgi:hypothetical protein
LLQIVVAHRVSQVADVKFVAHLSLSEKCALRHVGTG